MNGSVKEWVRILTLASRQWVRILTLSTGNEQEQALGSKKRGQAFYIGKMEAEDRTQFSGWDSRAPVQARSRRQRSRGERRVIQRS